MYFLGYNFFINNSTFLAYSLCLSEGDPSTNHLVSEDGFLQLRIKLLLFIWEVIGSNPVEDSDFFSVPRSWHADYFIFT